MGAAFSEAGDSLNCCSTNNREFDRYPDIESLRCVASGPGLSEAYACVSTHFTIVEAEDQADSPDAAYVAEIQGYDGLRQQLAICSLDSRKHEVRYVAPSLAGQYRIYISRAACPLFGSPFSVTVHPCPAPSKTLVKGPGLLACTAGSTAVVQVCPVDAVGNAVNSVMYPLKVTLVTAAGKPVAYNTTCSAEGYRVSFMCTEAGTLSLTLFLLDELVGSSPYRIPVMPGPIAPSKCFISGGEGAFGGFVERETRFVITACDGFGNQLQRGGETFEVLLRDRRGALAVTASVIDHQDCGKYHVYYVLPATAETEYMMFIVLKTCNSDTSAVAAARTNSTFVCGSPLTVHAVPSSQESLVLSAFTKQDNLVEGQITREQFFSFLKDVGAILSLERQTSLFDEHRSGNRITLTDCRKTFISLWPHAFVSPSPTTKVSEHYSPSEESPTQIDLDDARLHSLFHARVGSSPRHSCLSLDQFSGLLEDSGLGSGLPAEVVGDMYDVLVGQNPDGIPFEAFRRWWIQFRKPQKEIQDRPPTSPDSPCGDGVRLASDSPPLLPLSTTVVQKR